jgi:hypothetical protein
LDYRDLSFVHEPTLNVHREAATNAYYRERCYETFSLESRRSTPTVSTNCTTKGFYFIPDYSYYTSSANKANIPTTMDSGGIDFNYASSPDYYVYCHLDSSGCDKPDNSIPRGRLYYNTEMRINTATAPTWTAP